MEDNFLMQMIKEPTRGAAPLDLLFTNREGLVGVCYRPPNQDEETDELFYEQLVKAA